MNVDDMKFRVPVKLVTPPATLTVAPVITIPGARVMSELLTVTLHLVGEEQAPVTVTVTPATLADPEKLPEIPEGPL